MRVRLAKRNGRRLVVGLLAFVVALNLVAWQHARAFTRFGPPAERTRFTDMGLPSWGGPELLVFWGGVQQGFDGFELRPVDHAARIERPTLLMAGVDDPFVWPGETRRIFDGLRGEKTLRLLDGVGHESLLRARPSAWREAVSTFLERVASPDRGRR